MTDQKHEGAGGASRSDAVLDRASKLRADLDYIQAYLEEAHREFVIHEILIDPSGLLLDVTEFISRDNDDLTNK